MDVEPMLFHKIATCVLNAFEFPSIKTCLFKNERTNIKGKS